VNIENNFNGNLYVFYTTTIQTHKVNTTTPILQKQTGAAE